MHIIKIEFTNSLQLLVSANRRSISFLMHSVECQRQEKSCWICEFISPIINAQTFVTYFILCKRKGIFSGPSGEQYRVNRFYSRHLIVLASFLRKQVTGWRSISLNNKNCKPPWDDMWCVRYINTHSFIHSFKKSNGLTQSSLLTSHFRLQLLLVTTTSGLGYTSWREHVFC